MSLEHEMENLVELLQKIAGDAYEVSTTVITDAGWKKEFIEVKSKESGTSVDFSLDEDVFNRNSVEDVAKVIFAKAEDEFAVRARVVSDAASVIKNWNSVKPFLSAHVCQLQNNEEFLEGKTWYKYLDLAVYFKVRIECSEGIVNAVVTDDMLRLWNVTIEELKKTADENYPEEKIKVLGMNYPSESACKVMSFAEAVAEVKKKDAKAENVSYFFSLEYLGDSCGGNLITRTDILKQIAESMEKDLLIIPSSIESIVVLGCNIVMGTYDIQCEQIKDVNEKCFGMKDYMVLSEHAYVYSRKEERVLEESELDAYFNNN